MFPEISNLTFESGTYCQDLVDFLINQLAQPSCFIKLKVLKLLSYLIDKGHPSLVLMLRKKSTVITEAARYSGPPDPIYGMSRYQQVRQAAQELLKVLFDIESKRPFSPPLSSATFTSGMGNSSKSGTLTGFGNAPMKQSKSLGETIFASLRGWTESKIYQSAGPSTNVAVSYGNYRPIKLDITSEADVVIPKQNTSVPIKKSVKHIPGVAGGGWSDVDVEIRSRKSSASSPAETASDSINEIVTGLDEVTFVPELNLVDEFVKIDDRIPTRAELAAFYNKCVNLSSSAILERIVYYMSSEDVPGYMRCLMLLETFLYHDLVSVEQIFSLCSQALRHLLDKLSDGPSKNKARKLLSMLDKLNAMSSLNDSSDPTENKQTDACSSLNDLNEHILTTI